MTLPPLLHSRSHLRALALAAALATVPVAARCESALGTATGGQGVAVSAHLQFRITVLPALSLSLQGSAVQAVASGSSLALQTESGTVWKSAESRRWAPRRLSWSEVDPADPGRPARAWVLASP
ncbi:MAG: hypothetical protein RJA10_3458 [Pseudomonadota bacterium]|jgi:hypothetical protein